MTLDTTNIRQLTPDDFPQLYDIWLDGSPMAFSNPSLDLQARADFYQSFFQNALINQGETFRYWSYCEGGLLAWHSLLPCQAAPVLYHLYAETSLYVRKGHHSHGIGQFLMKWSLDYARRYSELAYVMGTNSAESEKSHAMLRGIGFVPIGDIPRSTRDTALGEKTQERIWFYVL